MKGNMRIWGAVLFPIVVLAIWTGIKSFEANVNNRFVLPIEGYDPRDLLSGHFLVYDIKYGLAGLCSVGEDTGDDQSNTLFVCLDPKGYGFERPQKGSCRGFIKGRCQGQRYVAGIERFYIPEEYAQQLDEIVRNKKAAIVVSVTDWGKATVIDLLINGVSWKEYLLAE